MLAVKRARSVRERDSRIGLQQATQERDHHRTRLDALQQQLREASSGRDSDIASFQARRHGLLALGEAIVAVGKEVEAAQQIVDSAHSHWSHDKVQLSAVESLLERRAEARRVERARREAKELDDIAGQLWLRNRTTVIDLEVAR